MQLQSTKPQSLAYAMMDSPAGVAAWIMEKFAAWSDLPRTAAGEPDLLARHARDQLLAEVMIHLVTRSFATSTWIYKGLFEEKPVTFTPSTRVEVPWPPSPTRGSCPRPTASPSAPTMWCIGRRCRAAGTSPLSRSRTFSWRTCVASRAGFDEGRSGPPRTASVPLLRRDLTSARRRRN